jgi:hypothetical protein
VGQGPGKAEMQWSTELGLGGPRAYVAGAWQAGCSFSKSWPGEAFHQLWVQSAEVSALSEPSMPPTSQQGP